jgi:hypothetical protein
VGIDDAAGEGADTGGELLVDPLPDAPADGTPDTVTDPGVDTSADPGVDTSVDPPLDTVADPGLDALDATDTVTDTAADPTADDATGDELPTTCTIADLVDQVMCGPGRKCTFTTVDAGGHPETFCDVAGAQGWNETCGGGGASDNCQAGYMCVSDWAGVSRCRRFCDADSLCVVSPGGLYSACAIGISSGGTTVVGATLCSFHCDVLNQTGCGSGQACRASFPGDGTHWTDCTSAGDGTECVSETANDCPSGWDCFGVDDDGDTITDYHECVEYCAYPSGSCSIGSCQQPSGLGLPPSIGLCIS